MVLVVKNPPANPGDLIREAGLIPELARFPGGGHGISLEYSFLENPRDAGVWHATIRGVTGIGHN